MLQDQLLNKQGLSVLMTELCMRVMCAYDISLKTHQWHVTHRERLSGLIFTQVTLWIILSRRVETLPEQIIWPVINISNFFFTLEKDNWHDGYYD